MKTIQKIGIILLIAMLAVTVFMPNVANAFSVDLTVNRESTNQSYLSNVIGNLLGFLQVASGLFAVLMIALTGFNYIIATPEIKEEMKKKMLPIIVGLVLVFGAVSIANFLLGVVVS